MEAKLNRLTYFSIIVLAIFVFVAFSITALHHILLVIPGLYFFYAALKKREWKLSPSMWALLGLILASIFSVMVNETAATKNIFKVKYFLIAFLGIFAVQNLINKEFTQKKARLIINLFLLGTLIASASGLIGLFSGFNPLRFKAACHPTRTCGMYGMYMTYAYGIQFAVTILIGLFLHRKKLTEWMNIKLFYSSLVINILGFVLSYARGAYLGLLCAVPFFFYRSNKKRFIAVFGILFILFSVTIFTVPKAKEVFFSTSRNQSTMVRLSQYKAAITVFKENPVLGVGYRNFEPQSKEIKKKHGIAFPDFGGHAHNNFLEHLASTGFLGFLSLLLFHLFWFREAYKRNDLLGEMIYPTVIGLFVAGQFQYTIGDGENLFLIMFLYLLTQMNFSKANS